MTNLLVTAACQARHVKVGDTVCVEDTNGPLYARVIGIQDVTSVHVILYLDTTEWQIPVRMISWAARKDDLIGIVSFVEDEDRDPECAYCGSPSPHEGETCGSTDCLRQAWEDYMYS